VAADLFERQARRVADALHAEAGQLFACMQLKLTEVELALDDRARPRLDELRALITRAEHEVRRLAHELRPAILDGLGVVPACESLAAGMATRHGVRISVRGSTGGRLPPDVVLAIYRRVQEALSNAARLARPTLVRVELRRGHRRISGRVVDDGVGFRPDVTPAGEPGIGLTGMRERIAELGGCLRVRSAVGRGTSISFTLPIPLA
jgi:signal transduction histidine kinase